MIYTLTLNPALDYVIRVDHFKTGQINRNTSENIYYGGKGINVSCILNELGIESTALGFIAGFTGKALQEGLEAMGIKTDFIEVSEGMTRINVKMKSDEETEINGNGPLIAESSFETLLGKIRRLRAGDTLIVSGRVPSCMGSDTYERIMENLDGDVRLIADAEKDLLLGILKYRPFLIKPNSAELAAISGRELRNDEEVLDCAERLKEMGARNVLVSMAKDGALLLDENDTVHRMYAARGTAVNSVGAGDSMVAGFLAGWLERGDYQYALRLGTACGAATAFHSGLAKKEEIEEVLKQLG